MSNDAHRDLLKVWLYAIASIVAAAVISPWFYNAGKAVAEVTEGKATNGLIAWVAGNSRAAEFSRFFGWSWLLAAVVLLVPFVEWLKLGRGVRHRSAPWSLPLPDGIRLANEGQRLECKHWEWRDGLKGFAVVSGLLLLLGYALIGAGVFSWKGVPDTPLRWVLQFLPWSIGLALVQEILFRGIVLGIFLRVLRPSAAIVLSALFFAMVKVLIPPVGLGVVDPDAIGAGFELLGNLMQRFGDPSVLFGGFCPLLLLGCVLGFARWRTASLWLPLGFHAGWIFANEIVLRWVTALDQANPLLKVLVKESLQYGLIPLGCLILGGILFYLSIQAHEQATSSNS